MYDEYRLKTENAVRELLQRSGVKSGDLVVVGCSSSEVLGEHIGKGSSPETVEMLAVKPDNISMSISRSNTRPVRNPHLP